MPEINKHHQPPQKSRDQQIAFLTEGITSILRSLERGDNRRLNSPKNQKPAVQAQQSSRGEGRSASRALQTRSSKYAKRVITELAEVYGATHLKLILPPRRHSASEGLQPGRAWGGIPARRIPNLFLFVPFYVDKGARGREVPAFGGFQQDLSAVKISHFGGRALGCHRAARIRGACQSASDGGDGGRVCQLL